MKLLASSLARALILVGALSGGDVCLFAQKCENWRLEHVLDPVTVSGADKALADEYRKERRHFVFLGNGFCGEYLVMVDDTVLHSGEISTNFSTGLASLDISYIYPENRPVLMRLAEIGSYSFDSPLYREYTFVYIDILFPNCIRVHHTNQWQLRD